METRDPLTLRKSQIRAIGL